MEEFSDVIVLAVECGGIAIWSQNLLTGETRYSRALEALLGYDEGEPATRVADNSSLYAHPDDLAAIHEAVQSYVENKAEKYEVEHRFRCKDGTYRWMLSRGKVVGRDEAGRPLKMVGTTTEITAVRSLVEELQKTVDRIKRLTNEIPGLVFQFEQAPDGSTHFPYASGWIQEIYEIAPEQVLHTSAPVLHRIHQDDLERYEAALAQSGRDLVPWRLEYRAVLPSRGVRWHWLDAKPTRRWDGGTVWHGLITDITERKRVEEELNELARIDYLTQLPNRRYFREQMEIELYRMRRSGGSQDAVLMIDIDEFKSINDTYGHNVGDVVIQSFARSLRQQLRKNDIAGRLGGEEFAVMLSSAKLPDAAIFASRLQKRISDRPILLDGEPIYFTISVGIAVMSNADEHIDISLSDADRALYQAKYLGRNRIEIAISKKSL